MINNEDVYDGIGMNGSRGAQKSPKVLMMMMKIASLMWIAVLGKSEPNDVDRAVAVDAITRTHFSWTW